MKKAVRILVPLLVICMVGLLMKRKMDLAQAKPAAILPVVVKTAVLTKGPVTLTLPAMGVVSSDLSTTLSTKVSGRVLEVLKKEGDRVKKGDILARIDARDLTARRAGLQPKIAGVDDEIASRREDVKALEASLATARESHQRTLELLAVKGASVEQSSQEETGIAGLEAKLAAVSHGIAGLEKSKVSLAEGIKEIEALEAYTVITAPIDGTISERLAMAGDLAVPGKPLFRIAAGHGLYLALSLPSGVAAKEVIFQHKRIALIPKNQAAANGLAQYVATLPEGTGVVEGEYCNVRVVVFAGEQTLVPVDGLLSMNGKDFVFIFGNKTVKRLPVEIVARGVEGVVVRETLAGSRVVVAKPDILLRISAGVPVLEAGGPAASRTQQSSTPAEG